MNELGHRPAIPEPLRKPLGVVAVLAAVLVGLLAVRYAGTSTPGALDRDARVAAFIVWPKSGIGIMLIAAIGDPAVAAAVAVVLSAACFKTRRYRLAILALGGPFLTGLLTSALKPVVARTISGYNLAYPSGHAGAVTALSFVTMLLIVDMVRPGRLGAIIFVLAGAILAGGAAALSLIALNVHYPTDTLGGVCTAMAIVPLTAWLIDRVPWSAETR